MDQDKWKLLLDPRPDHPTLSSQQTRPIREPWGKWQKQDPWCCCSLDACQMLGGLERGFPGPSLSLDLAVLASMVPLEPPGR